MALHLKLPEPSETDEEDDKISGLLLPSSRLKRAVHSTSSPEDLTVGKALLILFGSSTMLMQRACEADEGRVNAPLVSALRGIEVYLDRADNRVDALRQLFTPFVDKILKKDESERQKACWILQWLLGTRYGNLLATVLCEEMQRGSKRAKLAVALFTEVAAQPRLSDKRNISDERRGWRLLIPLIPLFAECLGQAGPLDENGRKSHTRLTMTSLRSALLLIHTVADQLLRGSEDQETGVIDLSDEVVTVIPDVSRLLQALAPYQAPWSQGLLVEMKQLLDIQSTIHASSVAAKNVASIISPLYIAISTGLDPKLLSMTKKKLTLSCTHILNNTSVHLNEPIHIMMAISCFFVQFPQSEVDRLLNDADIEPKVLELMQTTISSSLTVTLAHAILPTCGVPRMKSVIEALIAAPSAPLLAATALLKDVSQMEPDFLIEGLMNRVVSNNAKMRKNVGNVFQELLAAEGEDKKLRENLSARLLSYLDEPSSHANANQELIVLFTLLDPSEIVPKLSDRLWNGQGPTQPLAKECIITILSTNPTTVNSLLVLVDYIRKVAQGRINIVSSVPSTPGQIAQAHTPAKSSATDINEALSILFDVVSSWASSVDAKRWIELIPTLLTQVYASPSDTILVRLISSLAPFWANEDIGKCVVRWSVDVMSGQPRLTEELLKSDTEDSAIAVRDLLFLRLSPLLVLKVLAMEAIDWVKLAPDLEILDLDNESPKRYHSGSMNDDEMSQAFVQQLLIRAIYPLEFEQTRKLSLEVMSRLPFSTLHIVLTQALPRATLMDDLVQLRGWVYCSCMAIASRGVAGLDEATIMNVVVPLVFECLSQSRWATGSDPELAQKLQTGCIDFLSLVISLYATRQGQGSSTSPFTGPVIEEIDAEHLVSASYVLDTLIGNISPDETLHSIPPPLSDLMERILTKASRPMLCTSALNALTKSLQNLSMVGSEGKPGIGPDQIGEGKKGASWLAIRVMKPVLNAVEGLVNGEDAGHIGQGSDSAIVVAAGFQTLFHIVYTAKNTSGNIEHLPISHIAALCTTGLGSSSSPIVHTSALKLLAACIALGGEVDRTATRTVLERMLKKGGYKEEIGELLGRVLVALSSI